MSKEHIAAHRFKPGQSGNPGGKPKAKLTIDKIREMIERLSFLTRDELQAVILDQKTPMIELQLASIMAKAVKTGDYSRMQFILDRVVGKVADVNVNHNRNYDSELDKQPRQNLYDFIQKAAGE